MSSDPIPWDEPGSDPPGDVRRALVAARQRGILDRLRCRSCGYEYLPRAYPADTGLCGLCAHLTESISKEPVYQALRARLGFPEPALTGYPDGMTNSTAPAPGSQITVTYDPRYLDDGDNPIIPGTVEHVYDDGGFDFQPADRDWPAWTVTAADLDRGVCSIDPKLVG